MPQTLKTACLAAIAAALMTATLAVRADNASELAQQQGAKRITKDANWSLLLRNDGKVDYKGVASSDIAGAGTGQILYPAPSALGLLAAVITHGIIVGSVKSSQQDKELEAANRVLLPYQTILNDYKQTELMRRGLEMAAPGLGKTLLASSEGSGSDWLLESAPVFSMTQDQRAIILDSSIAIYPPGAPSAAAFQYTVRVVSQAKDDQNLVAFWTANQGEKLKEESAGLLAQSLGIALNEAVSEPNKDNGAHKTVRYQEGGIEKMERAQIVTEHCNRLVIRTLRGGLMSVPARPGTAVTTTANQTTNCSRG